ncbi:MAG: hypothetical protein WA081_07900 [Desulfosalsimonadaceae bacterium]
MNGFHIEIADKRTAFAPGETIDGAVSWQLDARPRQVFLRLFWSTKGKGAEDMEVVSEIFFDDPRATETRLFTMTLPQSPYSFTGKLVSLVWALELGVEGEDAAFRQEIVIAPLGQPVDLVSDQAVVPGV